MKKVLIIGHVGHINDMLMTTKMVMDKMPDAEFISHEEAEKRGITTNKAFEPEPIKFKIRDLEPITEPFITKNYSSSKYSGEKITTQRSERRKKNRDARNARRHF